VSNNVFFKGLNELRAIAALCVLWHHLELYCYKENRPSLFSSDVFQCAINSLGKDGVYLFFVLSGFLITYLLLQEKQQKSTVNIPKFYFRRIFRIWPLYVIIVILSFIIVPLCLQTNFFDSETYYMSLIRDESLYSTNNILLYVFFLSNFALPVVGASQSWSVSVEEQFYIIWPQFFRFFSGRKLLYSFIFLFCLILIIKAFKLYPYKYIVRIPIEVMTIGGVFAWFWYYYKNKLEKYFQSNRLFALNLLLIFIGIFFPVPRLIMAVVFGFLILFVISERSWNLRSRQLSFLGTISYGIYMYHPIIQFVSSAIANKFLTESAGYKVLLYVLTLSFTILISYVSYEYIEKKLIRIKNEKFNS